MFCNYLYGILVEDTIPKKGKEFYDENIQKIIFIFVISSIVFWGINTVNAAMTDEAINYENVKVYS